MVAARRVYLTFRLTVTANERTCLLILYETCLYMLTTGPAERLYVCFLSFAVTYRVQAGIAPWKRIGEMEAKLYVFLKEKLVGIIGRPHVPTSYPLVKNATFTLQFGDWVVRTKYASRRNVSMLEPHATCTGT
jgi:hypothetical protein